MSEGTEPGLASDVAGEADSERQNVSSTNPLASESAHSAEAGERAGRGDEPHGTDGREDAAVDDPAAGGDVVVSGDEAVAVDEAVAEDGPDPALTDPLVLRGAVEAILFVVDAPVTLAAIASALRQPVPAIEEAVAALRASYDERLAGAEIRDTAGGVRIYTRPEHSRHVERFLQDGQRTRLSQAALETLAVIAYRQPVTRSRVSAIRGVNVDGVVRTLLTRGLIVEVGADPESGAGLFRTSELFLERMGMQSLEELPSLAPLLPDLDGLETEEL